VASLRSRAASFARWLGPSASAALAGAVVAGVIEGAGMPGVLGVLATAGFIGLVAAPLLLVASALMRGLVCAWQPRALAASLVEDGGGSPRLAGWVAVLWLGTLAVAAAVFLGTRLLGSTTQFRPIVLAFAEPAIAVACALAVLALSRPAALGLAALARRLDARRVRAGRPTLLRPPTILAAALATTLVLGYGLWRLAIRPRLGPLDTSALDAPAAALVAVLAVHLARRHPRLARSARRVIELAVAALGVAAMAVAGVVVVARPTLALEIWGERALAGLAIELLFDLDRIRARVPLDELRPVERPGAAHPDILLITIDTVRADHTTPYGGTAAMPALGELGARGAVFDWAFAPSNVTRRSIPSMMIGLAPDRVRGRVVGWALRIDPRHVMVAERLRAGGYDTAGFMCCEGFWGQRARTGLSRGLAHVEIEHDGHKLARRARDWLAARERGPANRPLFLWMHLLEPHNWTVESGLPRNDDERRRFYDRSLEHSDRMLAEVLQAVAARPPAQAPIVIVTADHGEALGEHGHAFHSTDLYNSQLRVPLVLAGPGIAAQRVPETVSLTDLAPTLVELAGFEPSRPPLVDGRSFADLATGRRTGMAGKGTAFAAMIRDRSNPGGIRVMVDGTWKLIDNGTSLELYDLRSDPDELVDLSAREPAIVARLRLLLALRGAGSAFH
jgi:arylsulfatase A-like enzyme